MGLWRRLVTVGRAQKGGGGGGNRKTVSGSHLSFWTTEQNWARNQRDSEREKTRKRERERETVWSPGSKVY